MHDNKLNPVTDIQYKRELDKMRRGAPNIIDRYEPLAKSYGITGAHNIYWFGLANELQLKLIELLDIEVEI